MFALVNFSGSPRMISLPRSRSRRGGRPASDARRPAACPAPACARRVHRQVAEVARVPQHDGLHDAAVHVRLVDVRQRQADHVDVLAAGLAHRLGRAGHRRRRDRHDQLHVRETRAGSSASRRTPCRGRRRSAGSSTSVRSGYFSASRFLMYAIHSFWLAALSAPVMIANSPLPLEQPRRLVGQRVADALGVAWLTKKSRASGSASASQVSTLMPRSRALRSTVEMPARFSTATAIDVDACA